MVNGTETATMVTTQVITTAATNVVCAFFAYRANITLVPSAALIFPPFVDPYVEPAARPNYVLSDPVGAYFLTRSVVVPAAAGQLIEVQTFVSNAQSSGKRLLQIYCAATCASDATVSIVSPPTDVLLQSCTCRAYPLLCVLTSFGKHERWGIPLAAPGYRACRE